MRVDCMLFVPENLKSVRYFKKHLIKYPNELFSNSLLGDLEQLVSPDPEVTCIERDEQDNYMMVACDGIYDVMSNEEIVEFINDRFTREENEGNICNNLLDLCLYKVSTIP